MLVDFGHPSFSTLLYNSNASFQNKLVGYDNALVKLVQRINL